MNIGIENDSHFATHLYQTSSKSSMKSRLRIEETPRIPCFLKTTELNIDAFSMPQFSCRPPAFNNGLSNRNRLFCIENGMWTKLAAVSPDPTKLLKQTKYVGTHFSCYRWISNIVFLVVKQYQPPHFIEKNIFSFSLTLKNTGTIMKRWFSFLKSSVVSSSLVFINVKIN